jgi:hypothetical protein
LEVLDAVNTSLNLGDKIAKIGEFKSDGKVTAKVN